VFSPRENKKNKKKSQPQPLFKKKQAQGREKMFF